MRPLIVAEQLRRRAPGGIGTYVRGLANGLTQVDNAFGVWASKAPGDSDPLEELGGQVQVSKLPSPLLTRLWDRGAVAVPSGFDVVHATSMAVPPKGRVPMTVMVHDLAWRAFPEAFPPRGRRWHESALKRVIDRAARIIVPSQQSASDLMAGGVKGRDIEIVAHGCDHLAAPDKIGATEKLRAAGVGERQKFLLAVGTMEPRKNLARLIAAYDSIRDHLDEPVQLVIAGHVGWGTQVAPTEGVSVITDATAGELTALYEMAAAVAYVPLLEGFGLPVLEAMSQGTPVISSQVPAAGDATLLVDPTSTGAIADALKRISESASLREDLSRTGFDHARTFTWRRSAKAHLSIWEAIS